MSRHVDISPASVAQVQRAMDGFTVVVDDDVQNVAKDLKALGAFNLHYDTEQDVWIVMQLVDGVEHLVTSAQECDQRIVKRVMEVTSERYDLAGELEKSDREVVAAKEAEQAEQTGEAGERLLHALQTDLHEPRPVSFPDELPPAA